MKTVQTAAYDQGQHCLLPVTAVENAIKLKMSTRTSKAKNELIQIFGLDNSTGQTRVKNCLIALKSINFF